MTFKEWWKHNTGCTFDQDSPWDETFDAWNFQQKKIDIMKKALNYIANMENEYCKKNNTCSRVRYIAKTTLEAIKNE